jgi:hypothetical protein
MFIFINNSEAVVAFFLNFLIVLHHLEKIEIILTILIIKLKISPALVSRY